MTTKFSCPIIGCPHYPQGPGPKFSSLSNLIRHLRSDEHKDSRHLLNHSICNKINLHRCTHHQCASRSDIFFQSKRALDDHNTLYHPPPPQITNTETPNLTTYTNIIFKLPGSENLTNNWQTALEFISQNYNCQRPHFRSTWRMYLRGNNKVKFYRTLSNIISAIVHSSKTEQAEPFWWLLFHFEMLILAPTPPELRDNRSDNRLIHDRLVNFQCGNIELLLNDTTFNNNWNDKSPRPASKTGNSAAQIAADSDNYRTAITRACTFNKIATINKDNADIVRGLYPEIRSGTTSHTPPTNTHELNLPGNICETIRRSNQNKGTGIFSDSIDAFIHLVKQDIPTTNENLQHLFNLVYQGKIPNKARHFFTDTYLFCLHKDETDNKKLRPIGIPTAMRRLMATHIANHWKDKFALHLLPYNFAVGVPNGMDFIIKSMQLSIERFIEQPEEKDTLPSRAAIFVDLTNMFNSVSRAELFDIIATDFPELYHLTKLFYAEHGSVHCKWNNTSWKQLEMEDGVNQGCPLSPIFATLVLHRVLQPLAKALEQRAHDRLINGIAGDDGFGSLAHLFAYMDDISSTVAHEDIEFFCTEIERLGLSRGCIVNPSKTRILTSCSGKSIIPLLDPNTAITIERTISKYSVNKNKDNTTSPVELTSGFRLLGTPVGSKNFSDQFYNEQLDTVRESMDSMMTAITDTQTRLKLFTICTSQKLPHLLDSDIMHNYPTENEDDYGRWFNWAGPLTSGIDDITSMFFTNLLQLPQSTQLPQLAILISRLNVNAGGLGIINPSLRAAPDFVINMSASIRRTTLGFSINRDILPIRLHTSITKLFSYTDNTSSKCLQRYNGLLPHIAPLCCSAKCPSNEHIIAFESRTSPKSARHHLKKRIGAIITNQIYTEAANDNNTHLHLIPSILSPQTSYPLVGMCRSKQQNRLPNWMTEFAIKRKLRLPLYKTTHPPICKCGTTHDIYGDHAFKCKRISKTQSHHIIRDSWAEALQPALATAGYIRHTSKLQIERKYISTRDISARPFDICFEPDPTIQDTAHTPCGYAIIGADITIGNSCKPISSSTSLDVFSITAHADLHLKTFERKKFMRPDKCDTNDSSIKIDGELFMKDLLDNNMILLPFALDGHGRWSPIMDYFLSNKSAAPTYTFRRNRNYAQQMAYKATHSPCPTGILDTADTIWKNNKSRTFFGYSYTAPTPSVHTIQQLGLGITKGFSVLLRNAIRISTPHPAAISTSCNHPVVHDLDSST